ncbi:MAG: hypothetical protein IT420_08740 [Candidatus Brocadia sp.]|nr:hypothetical protein [Candidatus Brocadia sp.]MDG5995396.1 hypothetical protein [Candidatus Brocadia sp.]
MSSTYFPDYYTIAPCRRNQYYLQNSAKFFPARLVLSAVRLGLDADYDRLDDFADHHKPIRQILGVEMTCGEGKRLSRQSIRYNVSLLDEESTLAIYGRALAINQATVCGVNSIDLSIFTGC